MGSGPLEEGHFLWKWVEQPLCANIKEDSRNLEVLLMQKA